MHTILAKEHGFSAVEMFPTKFGKT